MKKLLVISAAGLAIVAGLTLAAAYEAHVINVTAHIENALAVDTESIDFGTVFPQEYLEKDFVIRLSDSFMDETQTRVKDVKYKIVQKPKCECDYPQYLPDGSLNSDFATYCTEGQYTPVDFALHTCPSNYSPMPDLCRFLSKLPDVETGDYGIDSYYQVGCIDACIDPYIDNPLGARGYLEKCDPDDSDLCTGDTEDCWTVDLKVPPVAGYEGQEWPDSCREYVVPTDGADYGCDLWIEVTEFSYFPTTP